MSILNRLGDMVGEILNYIPQIIGALIVLLLGYLVAKGVQALVQRGLKSARFDARLHDSDIGTAVERVTGRPAHLVAKASYWAVMIGVIALTASVLDIPALSAFVAAVFSYIPNLVAAAAVLLVAAGISTVAGATLKRALAGTVTGKVAAVAVPSVIMIIAVFMALNQLAIARDIVNITFTALVGSLALGMALAFGLGGREVAARMLEDAYSKGREGFAQAQQDIRDVREQSSMAPSKSQKEAMEPAEEEWQGIPLGSNLQPTFGETLNPPAESEEADQNSENKKAKD